MIYRVAVDESGTHEAAPAICVAACFADVRQWGRFERQWGPRAEKYTKVGFHATRAPEEDNAFLAAAIAESLGGMAVTIAYDDFAAVVTHRLRSRFGAEYATALRALNVVLAYYCHKNDIRWMSWVLEAGHKGAASAREQLDELQKNPAARIWAHRWVGKEDIDTHAPDLVAHLAAKAWAGERSPILDTLTKDTILVRHFERAELAEAVTGGEAMLAQARREKTKRRRRRQRGDP